MKESVRCSQSGGNRSPIKINTLHDHIRRSKGRVHGMITCASLLRILLPLIARGVTSNPAFDRGNLVHLQDADLSSSSFKRNKFLACKESYQAALPEILEVLKSACVTHSLPLTQTWVPCIQHGKEGCMHSNENYIQCVSIVDSTCYVGDHHVRGYQDACSEHHLLKGPRCCWESVCSQPTSHASHLT